MTDTPLQACVREALKLAADYPLDDTSTAGVVPGWDSLGWINILTLVEGRLAVTLPLEKVAEIRTLGELRRLVEEHPP